MSHFPTFFGGPRSNVWKETPEAHLFKTYIPGLKKEEVKVEVGDDRVLQISGSSGKFLRRFGLPENAKVDQVKASMENGVLTVTVPKQKIEKQQGIKPPVKAIDISG